MTLVDTINSDIKAAMLAKDKDKLEALRAIKAALLLANTSGKPVDENTEIQILQKLVKQRREAAEIYDSQNRKDLSAVENMQMKFIETYLPKQLSEKEITDEISKIIKDVNAQSIKDMGKVMGLASKKFAGKADNKVISDIVKGLLS
ncbi:MAG: GatB/YqeY domain-containing protein [Bacteroidales bacterium]|nr:GatB/YqeY domain-containing protein [Bacteroidales bacterium]